MPVCFTNVTYYYDALRSGAPRTGGYVERHRSELNVGGLSQGGLGGVGTLRLVFAEQPRDAAGRTLSTKRVYVEKVLRELQVELATRMYDAIATRFVMSPQVRWLEVLFRFHAMPELGMSSPAAAAARAMRGDDEAKRLGRYLNIGGDQLREEVRHMYEFIAANYALFLIEGELDTVAIIEYMYNDAEIRRRLPHVIEAQDYLLSFAWSSIECERIGRTMVLTKPPMRKSESQLIYPFNFHALD